MGIATCVITACIILTIATEFDILTTKREIYNCVSNPFLFLNPQLNPLKTRDDEVDAEED